MRSDDIEALVEDYVLRLAGKAKAPGSKARVAKCEAALGRAEEDLIRYRDNSRLLATLGEESFEAGVASRQRLLEQAALALAAARRAREEPGVFSAKQLEDSWPDFTVEERRDTIEKYIDCIFVVRGPESVTTRAHVCVRGTAPLDIPRRGMPVGKIRAFRPKKSDGSRPLPPMRTWSERRIERELVDFLGDRQEWPRYVEFSRAGRSRLHLQMMLVGGPYYWAHRLGLAIERRAVRWNQVRVRGALVPFLRRRKVWPSRSDFEVAGLASLHRAISHHGGVSFWAEEFDLPVQRKCRVYWTPERIQDALTSFVAGRETYPRPPDFFAAELRPLYTAICRNGGHRLWACRAGLPLDETSTARS